MNINDAELGKFMELAGETGIKVFLLHGDNWREAVANLAALPGSGNTLGDIRQTTDNGNIYRWNGSGWDVYITDTGSVLSSPTGTDTQLSSQGGLLKAIDTAVGDVSRSTDGWVEDEKHGIRYSASTATSTIKFSSTKKKTGKFTIQFDVSVNAAGFPQFRTGGPSTPGATWVINEMKKYGTPLKASTKYKIYFPFDTINTGGVGVYINHSLYDSTGTRTTTAQTNTSGTFDGVKAIEITTGASDAYGVFTIGYGSGTTGTLNVDWNNIRVEEIVEITASTLTSTAPSIVGVKAQGTIDSIDISQITDNLAQGLGTVNEQQLGQPFTPTKSKYVGFIMRRDTSVGTFVGNITVSIVNDNTGSPGTTVYAQKTYTSAEWEAIPANTDFTVYLPCELVTGSPYWKQLSSSTGDNTNYARVRIWNGSSAQIKAWNGSVWGSALTRALYMKSLYYKPTTNFVARQNNNEISISTDSSGFLKDSVIDIKNGTFMYSDNFTDESKTLNNIFSVNTPYLFVDTASSRLYVNEAMSTPNRTDRQPIFKVDMGDIATRTEIKATIRQAKIQYSLDGKNFIDGVVQDTTSELVSTFTIKPNQRVIFIKFVRGTATVGTFCYFKAFSIKAILNTSKIPVLYNYPTGKDIIQSYTKNLDTITTTAIYRATKFGFPAIEYSNGEYQFLEIDTTASGSTVAFSANGSSYTTVADGASIAITSTLSPIVWVKVNITANRIYLSSNDYNADGAKDGNMKIDIVYQVKVQGLVYDVQDLQKEVNELKLQEVPGITFNNGDITTEAGSYMIIPTATGNINLYKIPKAGTRFSIIIQTSGTTSYTLTFNTGFKSTGTLATGTVDAKYFTVNFISDGTQAIETSRTTAM